MRSVAVGATARQNAQHEDRPGLWIAAEPHAPVTEAQTPLRWRNARQALDVSGRRVGREALDRGEDAFTDRPIEVLDVAGRGDA